MQWHNQIIKDRVEKLDFNKSQPNVSKVKYRLQTPSGKPNNQHHTIRIDLIIKPKIPTN